MPLSRAKHASKARSWPLPRYKLGENSSWDYDVGAFGQSGQRGGAARIVCSWEQDPKALSFCLRIDCQFRCVAHQAQV